jgi:hypothetical protein
MAGRFGQFVVNHGRGDLCLEPDHGSVINRRIIYACKPVRLARRE